MRITFQQREAELVQVLDLVAHPNLLEAFLAQELLLLACDEQVVGVVRLVDELLNEDELFVQVKIVPVYHHETLQLTVFQGVTNKQVRALRGLVDS